MVCLGNICRSPAAQVVMEHFVASRGMSDMIEVDSAGLYGGHAGDLPDRRMRVHARRRGYELTHRSRKITASDLDEFDLIVVMDSSNERGVLSMASTPEQMAKVAHIGKYIRLQRAHYDHVPDPYYEGSEGFELALDLLEDACEALLDDLCKKFNYRNKKRK